MSKRKRDSFDYEDDDDDYEPMLGRQTLPVADLPYDFNGTPVDGLEYLFTVRRDARNLPHVTRAVNPYETPEEPPQIHSMRPKHPQLPSDDWRILFEKRFQNFRKNITQPTIYVELASEQKHSQEVMPDKRERDHWWAFISGRPEAEWNSRKGSKKWKNTQNRRMSGRMHGFPDDSEEHDPSRTPTLQETWHVNEEGEVVLAHRVNPTESLPTPSGSPTPTNPAADAGKHSPNQLAMDEERNMCKPREPTPGLIMLMDHRMCLHLLMYFTYWINLYVQEPELDTYRITDTHARWIFSLLSLVEDTVSADDMNLLRNLARAALALLKRGLNQKRYGAFGTITPDSRVSDNILTISEDSCWLIVTAIVGGWGQRDIWIDAEQMLVSLDQ